MPGYRNFVEPPSADSSGNAARRPVAAVLLDGRGGDIPQLDRAARSTRERGQGVGRWQLAIGAGADQRAKAAIRSSASVSRSSGWSIETRM